ncbi:hypothetical protein O8E94_002408 [Yersinia ruckeri]|nr:hypothetical protein [Yersinia ruckeri]ELM3746535.1 hypothetical protein [Yersinia ruckeri]
MANDSVKKLCEVMRKRSKEHAIAISRMNDLPGMMASILRLELDSMIRAIFLLSERNLAQRERLSDLIIKGQVWSVLTSKNKYKKVTDKEMVDLANEFQGWTRSVYKFGCSFVHFSNFHDYSENNPFESLSDEERYDILSHLRYYHGGPVDDKPSFAEIARYFPSVFRKISDNLECYLVSLENNETTTDGF